MVEDIVLRRVDTGEELDLSMVSTPYYILKSVDWGVIESTHHTYKYFNQIGVSVTGTSLETRVVEIDGWIIAKRPWEMSERKMVLNRFFSPQYAIDLLYDDYALRFIPDNTIQYGKSESENNDIIAQFKVQGTAFDPLFFDKEENGGTIAATTPVFHFPLIISPNLYEGGVIFGFRQPSLTAVINNVGSVTVGMKIIFRANGYLKNPKLINVNTRDYFQIDKEMVAEEEIEINTNVGEKSILGHIGTNPWENYFMYKNLDSVWLQLEVGDTILRYDADLGLDNLEVYIRFYNKYLEVQQCY